MARDINNNFLLSNEVSVTSHGQVQNLQAVQEGVIRDIEATANRIRIDVVSTSRPLFLMLRNNAGDTVGQARFNPMTDDSLTVERFSFRSYVLQYETPPSPFESFSCRVTYMGLLDAN